MEFTSRDVLKSALGGFFKDNFYKDAVNKLRHAIREKEYYKENWENVVWLILNRELNEDEPLYLMDNDANLPLDENTDEEAYKWLNLMLINSMGGENSPIIEY